ncbi:hypothetical protein [Alteribacillus bidgolensis]|uniref:Uncharacterized protein n=1 Tax=Alteribacillus bidgolensis TaxID=930129 RepID=A0A1G8QIB1_9BACI|nr:hypothetical protein [Alteribacillus bidgolensis]SDJ04457.1 hypothetical protein SAMN05216352_12014 [Alteribacillus bidgolensis]
MLKTNRRIIRDQWSKVLNEPEIEVFLLELQNYLMKTKITQKKFDLTFYRNISLLNEGIGKLTTEEKKLLQVKIDSFIIYVDNVNRIQFPSPFIIGVFTAVVSLVLGMMIRDPAAFPNWAIMLVMSCFVLVIPGISWLNLDQSVKNAEVKEVLVTIKGILELSS